MLIERVAAARVEGHPGLVDLVLRDGLVTAIEPAVPAGTAVEDRGRRALSAGGRVVVPAFVDAHVHLDKAHLLAAVEADGPVAPRLDAAIAAVDRVRQGLDLDAVRDGARRAVAELVRHGTVAARVQVEVEPRSGLSLLELQRDVALEVADRVDLQLVAFPQLGLERPGAVDLLEAAMGEGATVVGGCPYVDEDPVAHLDRVFAVAQRWAAPVDLHLDFTDDLGRMQLDLVIERTRALGVEGTVTVGHVTALAALDVDAQRAAFERLAGAGIALVVLPATDLYLGGHGEPGTRSLAPIERAAAAGVEVAIASNNLDNPFAPFGNGSLVHAAWLAGIARRLGDPTGRRLLLDSITAAPGRLLGRARHGPTVGGVADLVLLDTCDPAAAIAQAPGVLATVRAGHRTW